MGIYTPSLTKRLLLAQDDDSEILKSLLHIEQRLGRPLTPTEIEKVSKRLVEVLKK